MEISWTEMRAAPARPVGLLWVLLTGVLIGLLFLMVAQAEGILSNRTAPRVVQDRTFTRFGW